MIVRSDDVRVDWTAKDKARVIQNVHNLIRMWEGEVPFARDVGLHRNALHGPVNERIPLLEANVAKVISEYEPMAVVNRVTVFQKEDGYYGVEVDVDAGE